MNYLPFSARTWLVVSQNENFHQFCCLNYKSPKPINLQYINHPQEHLLWRHVLSARILRSKKVNRRYYWILVVFYYMKLLQFFTFGLVPNSIFMFMVGMTLIFLFCRSMKASMMLLYRYSIRLIFIDLFHLFSSHACLCCSWSMVAGIIVLNISRYWGRILHHQRH